MTLLADNAPMHRLPQASGTKLKRVQTHPTKEQPAQPAHRD
jgi:hypothetical protein